jgi:hypothetical protein
MNDIAATKPELTLATAILSLIPRMVRIGADGQPTEAKDHVAVLLPDYGLMFDVGKPHYADSQAEAIEAGAACRVLGHEDWQLASVEELRLLCRYDRSPPAIDTEYFPETPTNDWFWTRSDFIEENGKPSSVCAWFVCFGDGHVFNGGRGGSGFVRACRRVPSRQ